MSKKSALDGIGVYTKDGTALHYQQSLVETIDKMERIYGTLAAIIYCELTEFKYRDRLGVKEGESPEKDLVKIGWYKRKKSELMDKADSQLHFNKELFLEKLKRFL